MALKDPEMSTQGTVGKRKHTTLMIPQKLEIIRRVESSESCSGYDLLQHYIVNCVCYKETEGPIMIAYGIKCVMGLFRQQILKEPKLAELDKMLYSGLQQCVLKETL